MKHFGLGILTILGIAATHFAYGLGFLRGLFIRPKLKPHSVKGDSYLGG